MNLLMIHDPDTARFMLLRASKGKVYALDERGLGQSSEQVLRFLRTIGSEFDSRTPIEYYSTCGVDFSDEVIHSLFFGAKTVEDLTGTGYFFEDKKSNLGTFDELLTTLIKDGETQYVRGIPPKDMYVPHGFSPFYVIKSGEQYVNLNWYFGDDNLYEAARFLTYEEALDCAWERDLPEGFQIETQNYLTYATSSFIDDEIEGYGSPEN